MGPISDFLGNWRAMFKIPLCGCVYSLNGKQQINSSPWCSKCSNKVDGGQSFSFSIKGHERKSSWPSVFPVKNWWMLILVYDSSQQLVSQSKIIKDYLHIILLCLSRQVESKNTLNKKGKVKGKTMTITQKRKIGLNHH